MTTWVTLSMTRRDTAKSCSCSLKQLQRALWVAEVVTVGRCYVALAVQAQEADGQAPQRGHHPGRVSRPDQRFVFQVSHVPHPVKTVFYLPVTADPRGQGRRAGVAVAGDEVDDLDGLLPVLGDGAAQLRDLGRALEPDPGRRQHGLDGAPRPAAVARAHGRE